MSKTKKTSHKRLATLWGEVTRSAIDHGLWFGPKGRASALEKIPSDQVKRMASKAIGFAIKHRARYPLKGQANA